MSPLRTTTNLLIAGTAFALLTVSAMADNGTQTLGTLPRNEAPASALNAPQKTYYADPGSAATYTASQAVPDESVLQPMQAGNITYVTGGIGDEEIAALNSAKKDYNLQVMSASVSGGAFKGNTQITLRNRKGDELLTTDAGPIFLAKLDPGSYVVEATSNGQTKRQTVSVGHGKAAAHVHFGWQ